MSTESVIHVLVESRFTIALATAVVAGAFGLHHCPISTNDPFLAAIAVRRPDVLTVIGYGYALLWFSTPFHLASLLLSMTAIVSYRKRRHIRFRALPPYPAPERRAQPSIVLG